MPPKETQNARMVCRYITGKEIRCSSSTGTLVHIQKGISQGIQGYAAQLPIKSVNRHMQAVGSSYGGGAPHS